MKPVLTPQTADWHAIERDYRAGLLSLREMSKLHGINHVAIKRQAEKLGWTRDLQAKINAKASELLNRAVTVETTLTLQDERSVIDTNAQVIANIRAEHRNDIRRARVLANALMAELEAQTFDAVLMSELGTLMRNPDDSGSDRLNDLYRKVISTPGRVDTAKKLVETMKSLVTMEREAYSIDAIPAAAPVDAIGEFLANMKRSALPVVYEVERDDSL